MPPCGAVFILLKLLQAPEQQRPLPTLTAFLFSPLCACLPSKNRISALLCIRPSQLRISSFSWHSAAEYAFWTGIPGLAPAVMGPEYQPEAPPATLTAASLLCHNQQLCSWSLISPISSRHTSSTDQILFPSFTLTTSIPPLNQQSSVLGTEYGIFLPCLFCVRMITVMLKGES